MDDFELAKKAAGSGHCGEKSQMTFYTSTML